jgi:hypothetical protein
MNDGDAMKILLWTLAIVLLGGLFCLSHFYFGVGVERSVFIAAVSTLIIFIAGDVIRYQYLGK